MAGKNDDPFADIGAEAADPFADIVARPSVGAQALDVAKQLPSGLLAGIEAIPTAIPRLIGAGIQYFAPESEPAQRMRAMREKYGEPGISPMLPEPQTTAGKYARTTSEFAPTAVLQIPRAVGSAVNWAAQTVPALRRAGVATTAGAASEAAGQATEGTAFEPAARVVGGLATGHVVGRQVENAATKAAIRQYSQEAEQSANRAYGQFRTSGFELDPSAGAHYAVPLKTTLTSEGLTARTAGHTWAVLDDIERTPFTNPVQLQERYKELGSVIKKATTDPEERRAASIAQERLLHLAENPPSYLIKAGDPAAGVALLREANANWAAVKRAERLNQTINTAELRAGSTYSGLNLENQLRQRVGMLSEPSVRGGYSQAEREAFQRFGQGGAYPGANAVRYARNVIGGGGGMGALVGAAGVGAGVGGSALGLDPLTYTGATLLAGLGATKYSNMRALNRAREIELQLLSRSPYAASVGAPNVSQPGGLSFVGPLMQRNLERENTLATLGD
jgi:hypothetical protein